MFRRIMKQHTSVDVNDRSESFEENFWEFLADDVWMCDIYLICFSGLHHFTDNT